MFESIAYAMGQLSQTMPAGRQAQGQQAPSPLVSFMPIILIFAIFYFLLIRPQQKKQKDHQKMLGELKKNDEIITTGGVHGTIVNVKENTFTIRVNENVRLEISKSAVAGLKKKPEASNQ